MSGKPLFAKLAVVLLIGINLGAYYAFWPDHGGAGKAPAPDLNAGQTSLPGEDKTPAPVAKKDEPADPKQVDPLLGAAPEVKLAKPAQKLPPEVARNTVQVPPLPLPTAKGTSGAAPVKADGVPALPLPAPKPAADLQPPPLPKDPIVPPLPESPSAGVTKKDGDDEQARVLRDLQNSVAQAGGVAPPPSRGLGTPPAPLAPAAAQPLKFDNSPWTLQMEIVGGQTLLRARLHQQTEFRILCDRVEMKASEGGVQALGHVRVSGSGVTASCEKLTLPLSNANLLLQGQADVKITSGAAAAGSKGAPAWELKGESLSLRLADLPCAAAPPPVVLPGLPGAVPAPPPPVGRLVGPK